MAKHLECYCHGEVASYTSFAIAAEGYKPSHTLTYLRIDVLFFPLAPDERLELPGVWDTYDPTLATVDAVIVSTRV